MSTETATGVSFTARGIPMPKGSTTRMPTGAMIPAGTNESRRKMAQWRDDIRAAAKVAMGERPPYAGAIRLFCEFGMPVPKSMPKSKQGWLPHTTKPDVDKLFRALSDALTGIAWVDDSQVCVSAINKVYAWDGRTGASVSIEVIEHDAAQRYAEQSQRLREMLRREESNG